MLFVLKTFLLMDLFPLVDLVDHHTLVDLPLAALVDQHTLVRHLMAHDHRTMVPHLVVHHLMAPHLADLVALHSVVYPLVAHHLVEPHLADLVAHHHQDLTPAMATLSRNIFNSRLNLTRKNTA